MNWTYSIKNKILASGVLLALCLLVLLSHYLDRVHTESIKNAMSTMYEDRLIAEAYILKMTSNIYQIREVLYSDLNNTLKSNAIHKSMDDFNDSYNAYSKTKLTILEKVTSTELISLFRDFEQIFSERNYGPSNYTEKALVALSKLSTVQLEESKLIMKNVESEYANIKASSQLAYAIVIIILLVLQALVFSAKTLMTVNEPKDPTLN
jgi:hypothetical protein